VIWRYPGVTSLLANPTDLARRAPQAAPYSWYQYVALATLVISIGCAAFLTRRDPSIAAASVVADLVEAFAAAVLAGAVNRPVQLFSGGTYLRGLIGHGR